MSQNYIKELNLDWNRIRRIAFNDRSNPDDDELGVQIVKDLHRTGCSAFSGQDNEQDRALLKRVLLAFARYNKSIGYCQGFNIIAALILEIVDKKEEDALICMIYLIDHILPEGYFTNSMHSLAIDMAVFREILKNKFPKLCEHLNALQMNSSAPQPSTKQSLSKLRKSTSNISPKLSSTYEPPLVNVFTMQWFLTLFATCLPKNVLLRVWDSIFLEGSEILFRTSIAIWEKLSVSVMKAQSADAFYSMMSLLTVRLFEPSMIDESEFINKIYAYGSFPYPGLNELREKFTFSITPFQMCIGNSTKKSKTSHTESLSNLKLSEKTSGESGADILVNIGEKPETKIGTEVTLSLRKIGYDEEEKPSGGNYEEDDDEVEDLAKMISCFALLTPSRFPIGSSNSSTSTNSGADIMMTAAAAVSSYGMKQKSNAASLFSRTFGSKGKFTYLFMAYLILDLLNFLEQS